MQPDEGVVHGLVPLVEHPAEHPSERDQRLRWSADIQHDSRLVLAVAQHQHRAFDRRVAWQAGLQAQAAGHHPVEHEATAVTRRACGVDGVRGHPTRRPILAQPRDPQRSSRHRGFTRHHPARQRTQLAHDQLDALDVRRSGLGLGLLQHDRAVAVPLRSGCAVALECRFDHVLTGGQTREGKHALGIGNCRGCPRCHHRAWQGPSRDVDDTPTNLGATDFGCLFYGRHSRLIGGAQVPEQPHGAQAREDERGKAQLVQFLFTSHRVLRQAMGLRCRYVESVTSCITMILPGFDFHPEFVQQGGYEIFFPFKGYKNYR